MKGLPALMSALLLFAVGCQFEGLTGGMADENLNALDKRPEVKMVPFEATSSGHTVEMGPHADCPEGTLRSRGEGTGKGLHVGAYTMTNRHCVDPGTGIFTDGFARIVTPNGDEVWFEYEGYLDTESSWVMTESIAGGTGRFEHATGSIDGNGVLHGGGSFTVYEKGVISSVGSSR